MPRKKIFAKDSLNTLKNFFTGYKKTLLPLYRGHPKGKVEIEICIVLKFELSYSIGQLSESFTT